MPDELPDEDGDEPLPVAELLVPLPVAEPELPELEPADEPELAVLEPDEPELAVLEA